jgi:hypothetical protein
MDTMFITGMLLVTGVLIALIMMNMASSITSTILSVMVLGFIFYLIAGSAVESKFLGRINESAYHNHTQYVEWVHSRINESECAGKEILSTFDCCGGYITTYCKKFPFPAYQWTEMHAMDNTQEFRWWYE